MRQSELTYCANRAGVLARKILDAKGVVNAQQPALVLEAIAIAEDIADRLRAQDASDETETPQPVDVDEDKMCLPELMEREMTSAELKAAAAAADADHEAKR